MRGGTTSRDRQLLGVLAEARLLSEAQVKRLFWPRQTRQAFQRRLLALSRGERPLLAKQDWYTRDGRQSAWALTEEGYAEAAVELDQELEPIEDALGTSSFDHHLLMTELFVGLLAAPVDARAAEADALSGAARSRALAAAYARARHPTFRWRVEGDRDLPWKQPADGALRQRVIRPDAILDFPHSRRRVFVESELGTNTITPRSRNKPNATIEKAKRYEAFLTGVATPQPRCTWYQARFPDRAAPEVLFLVRTEHRRASVSQALDAWRSTRRGTVSHLRVATVEGALAEYLPLAWEGRGAGVVQESGPVSPGAGKEAEVSLSRGELRAVERFFAATVADFKRRRDAARARRGPVPEYPEASEEVQQFLRRRAR